MCLIKAFLLAYLGGDEKDRHFCVPEDPVYFSSPWAVSPGVTAMDTNFHPIAPDQVNYFTGDEILAAYRDTEEPEGTRS